jgi:carboxymethylenebutenolidase
MIEMPKMWLRSFSALTAVALWASVSPSVLAQTSPAEAGAPEVTFSSGKLTLHGYLYKPAGDGPFPAVLWNHGSEKLPGWLPQLGPLFTRRGYVFFIPHRRGQGRSSREAPYIMDLLEREREEHGRAARSRKLVELQEVHLEDQLAALEYVKSLPYVDAKRIAAMGCSFGGIQTVLAAEKGAGLRAAVDFAGAAESWQDSPDIRELLLRAVRNAKVPILFIQAEGDYDLSPSKELGKAMEKAHKPHQVHLYPRFGATNQENHAFCVRGAEIWSAEVLAFLEVNMAEGKK